MTAPLLSIRNLDLDTPGGRPLLRDLTLQLEGSDRVAIIGRNGVGKTTLLRVLSGGSLPGRGRVTRHGSSLLIPQHPAAGRTASPGEVQRARLLAAFESCPDLLLLDEPTHDLDSGGIDWLVRRLSRWRGGLVVVSHERRLLRHFEDFFVVAESGCHHVHGSFDQLLVTLQARADRDQARYARELADVVARERSHERTRRRRERKANRGRIKELQRCTPRSVLNGKRSYAQESQGKRAKVQHDRLERARAWAKATRRALRVELPLRAVLPPIPLSTGPAASLRHVDVSAHGQRRFTDLTLAIDRERIAVVGPNGAGKTTLLEALVGVRRVERGAAHCDPARIAYVAQNAENWRLDETTLCALQRTGSLDDAASLLQAHRFPFALADRPLRELSPGERLRAALICALHRGSTPDVLVLDEPTDHLDFAGLAALETLLRAWRGGVVIVSHDASFLDAIGIDRYVELVSKNPTELPSGSWA